MLVAMQQQLAGKVGNAGNNAFKLRKLFKMYDRDGTGQVLQFGVTADWKSVGLWKDSTV